MWPKSIAISSGKWDYRTDRLLVSDFVTMVDGTDSGADTEFQKGVHKI